MKNRRILVAAFLCFAMLITAVGYATLSGHLTIQGTSSYDKDTAEDGFVGNLVFSNPQVLQSGSAQSDTNKDSASVNEQTASFEVKTLAVQDETAVFSYTLTNNNVVDAKITIEALHDDGDPNPTTKGSHYTVDSITIDNVAFITDHLAQTSATVTIGAGDSVTVQVTVSLDATPTTNVIPENFYMHVTATSVDN